MKKGLFEPDKEISEERLEQILDYEIPQEILNARAVKKAEEIVNKHLETASDDPVKLYYYDDKESGIAIKRLYAETTSGDFILEKLIIFYEQDTALKKDAINIGSKISKTFKNYKQGIWEDKLDRLYEKLKEKDQI